MINPKITQISKFELHNEDENCKKCKNIEPCDKSIEEFESIQCMVYEFLIETMRLENLEIPTKLIEIGPLFLSTRYVVRINKMMLHRYSEMTKNERWILNKVVMLFNHVEFIIILSRERLSHLEGETEYSWSKLSLGLELL